VQNAWKPIKIPENKIRRHIFLQDNAKCMETNKNPRK
jgi:hypothetical protein